ncbi:AGE family epimerase/isomerase [Ferroacidibacillus organovorans]|uniref:N-acylglucosamine 2-epimerase n=1 Tax=Ferroacidibacillus organovorans TaxID=1765683 RepID=A0A101XPX3_9BACL|nr:AGE family epimerase/isomerase [Ferroacidibacillus organovorans]KUO95395.1 hypothetical protein ATW55_11120 [Ferroacidibacillus organovorans]
MQFESIVNFYKEHLENVILPFWAKNAMDLERGGIYTCFGLDGTVLINRDKYTWSQGRFLWLAARLVRLARAGDLFINEDLYMKAAKKTASFLLEHVFLENGHCAFVLSEDGTPKYVGEQKVLDASIYGDCFVCLGLIEYADLLGDKELLHYSWDLYQGILMRVKTDDIVTEPYIVPKELTVHGIPMILLNLSFEFYKAFKKNGDSRVGTAMKHSLHHIDAIWNQCDGQVCILREHVVKDVLCKDAWNGTLLYEHIAPGHTAESMWMIMEVAHELSDHNMINRCVLILKHTFYLAWDDQYGGLFRFVGLNGGAPTGRKSGSLYEEQILDTWDMKLWWVHTEFLYAAWLGWTLTRDQECKDIAGKLHQYTFSVFPNPNHTVGEWLQKRNRQGLPLDKVVALPVKDPYHIMRNLILLISLTEENV